MSDDQDGCEWVRVSSGTGLPGCPGPKAVKQLCVCAFCRIFISKLGRKLSDQSGDDGEISILFQQLSF